MSSYGKSHESQSSPQLSTFLFKTFPRKKRTPRTVTGLKPLWLSSPSIKGGSSRLGESVESVLPHQSRRSSETFTLDLGNGETSVQLKRTETNEKLAAIARVNPKRAKRMLANRQSTARWKDRPKVSLLEKEAENVQNIVHALSFKLTQMRADPVWLENLNSERRIEFEALTKLVEDEKAREEAMAAEIRRLKDATKLRIMPRKHKTKNG